MIASIVIFIIAYVLIASEKLNKTIVAILGATMVLALNLVPYKQAMSSIDLNVLFLIIGMMTMVFILSKTGFFEWAAIIAAKKAEGNPHQILLYLTGLTAVLSALLDNVTTVVLLAPVTILLAQILEISAVPFLILEVIASNIGGTATLIGDPPNIIIGSQAGLSFDDFIIHLAPLVLGIFVVFCGINFVLFKNRFSVPEKVKLRIAESIPHLAIIDFKMMVKSLIILALVMLAFFFHHWLGLKPGIIALGGAALMLLVTGSEGEETFREVEWGVIFFLIGLFIMISALEYNGVMQFLAGIILQFSAGNIMAACLIVLWGSALISAFLDNIPFVITMIPLVKAIITYFAQSCGITNPVLIDSQIAQPLWWSLALGACLGGNGTLIGASANIVVAHIGNKNKAHISFFRFMTYGFPYMILSLVLSSLYVIMRYFIF